MTFQPIDFHKKYGSNAEVTPLFQTKTLGAKQQVAHQKEVSSSSRAGADARASSLEADSSHASSLSHSLPQTTSTPEPLAESPSKPAITQEDLAKARMEGFEEGYNKGYSTAITEEKKRQEQLLVIAQALDEKLAQSEQIINAKELEYQREIISTAIALAQYTIADPSFVPPEKVLMGVISSLIREMSTKRKLTLYVCEKICTDVKKLFKERMPDRYDSIDILPKSGVDILWCDIQYEGGGITYHANEILEKMTHIQQQTLASEVVTTISDEELA